AYLLSAAVKQSQMFQRARKALQSSRRWSFPSQTMQSLLRDFASPQTLKDSFLAPVVHRSSSFPFDLALLYRAYRWRMTETAHHPIGKSQAYGDNKVVRVTISCQG